VNCVNPLGDPNWDTTFAVTLWWLWKWRNSRVFRDDESLSIDPVAFIQGRCREIILAHDHPFDIKNDVNENTSKVEALLRWNAPPDDGSFSMWMVQLKGI